MNYSDVWGWFDYASLYDAAIARVPNNAKIVELGCFMGRSTAYLGQLVKDSSKHKEVILYAIDNWEGAPLDGMDRQYQQFAAEGKSGFDRFMENMIACDVDSWIKPIQLPSVEAAKQFDDKSLDFCFIDADHSFDSVCADIRAWLPKMKSGSWLAGHDYDRSDVSRAVHLTFSDIGDLINLVQPRSVPHLPSTCWLYEVP